MNTIHYKFIIRWISYVILEIRFFGNKFRFSPMFLLKNLTQTLMQCNDVLRVTASHLKLKITIKICYFIYFPSSCRHRFYIQVLACFRNNLFAMFGFQTFNIFLSLHLLFPSANPNIVYFIQRFLLTNYFFFYVQFFRQL